MFRRLGSTDVPLSLKLCFGFDPGHNYVRHNYVRLNYVGLNHAGHNHTGHNYIAVGR